MKQQLMFVVAASSAIASGVFAQDPPPPVHLTEHLILGRACVKEESLWPPGTPTAERPMHVLDAEHFVKLRDGCWGIDQVYQGVARRSHWSYERAVREYSPNVFTPDEDRPWVADLRVGAYTPLGWPSANLPWNERPDRPDAPTGYGLWMRAFHMAATIRDHTMIMPYGHKCPVPPDHWGGACDHWRGVANGWVQEKCGEAKNEFWIVPAWHTSEELERARLSLVGAPIPADVARGAGHR